MKHAKHGIAAWPREENWLQDGDELAVRGHLDADGCQSEILRCAGNEDGVVVQRDRITHTYARAVPERGGGVRVDWPYPRGLGAFRVTVVELVNADEVKP